MIERGYGKIINLSSTWSASTDEDKKRLRHCESRRLLHDRRPFYGMGASRSSRERYRAHNDGCKLRKAARRSCSAESG
jgi:hypothetical protein